MARKGLFGTAEKAATETERQETAPTPVVRPKGKLQQAREAVREAERRVHAAGEVIARCNMAATAVRNKLRKATYETRAPLEAELQQAMAGVPAAEYERNMARIAVRVAERTLQAMEGRADAARRRVASVDAEIERLAWREAEVRRELEHVTEALAIKERERAAVIGDLLNIDSDAE